MTSAFEVSARRVRTAIAAARAIRLEPWAEEQLYQRGAYPIGSDYVEHFWLPLIGPSAYCIARRLSGVLEARNEAVVIPLDQLGPAVGIGRHCEHGAKSPLSRALSRLAGFGLAEVSPDASPEVVRVGLRRRWPPLAEHRVRRLPPFLARQLADGPQAARQAPGDGASMEIAGRTPPREGTPK